MFNRTLETDTNNMVIHFDGDKIEVFFKKFKTFKSGEVLLFPSVNESAIGTLLADFLSTDFLSKQSFQDFVDNWGVSGFIDFSETLSSLKHKQFSNEEIEKIIYKIQKEVSPIMIKAQRYFKRITDLCLKYSVDWNDYSIHQRYYMVWVNEKLVQELNDAFPEIDSYKNKVKTMFTMRFKNPHSIKVGDVIDNFQDTIKKAQFSPGEVYESINIVGLLCIEFQEVIKRQIYINQCGNCDNYFLPQNRIDTKYCTRIKTTKNGSKLTCQQIGATKKYSRKMKDNTVYKEYRKKYKTNFARHKSGAWDERRWKAWSAAAKKKFNEYRNKTEEDDYLPFLDWLEESSQIEWYKKRIGGE